MSVEGETPLEVANLLRIEERLELAQIDVLAHRIERQLAAGNPSHPTAWIRRERERRGDLPLYREAVALRSAENVDDLEALTGPSQIAPRCPHVLASGASVDVPLRAQCRARGGAGQIGGGVELAIQLAQPGELGKLLERQGVDVDLEALLSARVDPPIRGNAVWSGRENKIVYLQPLAIGDRDRMAQGPVTLTDQEIQGVEMDLVLLRCRHDLHRDKSPMTRIDQRFSPESQLAVVPGPLSQERLERSFLGSDSAGRNLPPAGGEMLVHELGTARGSELVNSLFAIGQAAALNLQGELEMIPGPVCSGGDHS